MTWDMEAAPRWILGGWVVLLAVVAVLFVSDVSFSGGWADLVLAVGVLVGALGLAAIAVTWVLVRFVLDDPIPRVVASIVGPPLLTVAAIILLRAL